jgi:TonB family protein
VNLTHTYMRGRSRIWLMLTLVVMACALSALAQTKATTSDWSLLTPEGEDFTILMPKDWAAETGEQNYHKMVLKTRLYLSAAKPGPVLAVASISGIKSNPALYSEFQRLNSYVDAFKNWFPEKVRGKEAVAKLTLVREKNLNGNSGREYRLTIGDLTGTAQMYATKKRFYAAVVLNTKKDDDLEDRFLSSFVIPERTFEPPAQVAKQPTTDAAAGGTTPPVANRASSDGQKTEPPAEANSSETKPGEVSDAANPQPGQKRAPISGGVLNGKALYLPKPDYPAEAHNAKASGVVVVQVTIDEQGGVISAKAVSGHPTLQQASVNAALQARFSPTMLMGEPVKVTGVLTYNFAR